MRIITMPKLRNRLEKPVAAGDVDRAGQPVVITIARDFGAEGHEIGKMLSSELGIPLYDNEILVRSSMRAGESMDRIAAYDEQLAAEFMAFLPDRVDARTLSDKLWEAMARVIVDLGAGVEKPVRLFASSAANLLIVCTDEPTSLTDAYAFIKMICLEQPQPNIRIIVNSATSNREGERTYTTLLKACQGFLRISPPLAGVIRRDTRVRDSIRNQMSILTRHPTTEAAEDVLAVAARLNKERE